MSEPSHQPEEGKSHEETFHTHQAKPTRKVQWPDERRSELTHELDEHGLNPVAFESLTTALERHSSLSPQHEVPLKSESNFTTLPSGQDEPSGHPNGYFSVTTSSGTSSATSSGTSSPTVQWTVPGNFIDAHENAGLPGTKDSDSYAQTRAARVVRTHTRKLYSGLGRKPRVRDNKESFTERHKSRMTERDRLSDTLDSTDIEHDAAAPDSSLPIGGGVLSALLTLYNERQDSSSAATPSTLGLPSRQISSEKSSIRGLMDDHPETSEDIPSRKPFSRLTSDGPSSRGSSPDGREDIRHRRHGRTRSKVPRPSSIFYGGKPKQARSDAGVLGPLIASTGNLMGVGSPASGELQPNVKRPGFHLLRYTKSTRRSAPHSDPEPTALLPQPQSTDSKSLPGTGTNTPSSPPSPDRPGAPSYKTKWTGVLKDLGGARARSSVGALVQTPFSMLEGEDYFPTKHQRDERKADKREKRRKRKKAEVFITRHVAKIIQRQEFLLKLARAMMMFGGPSHRLQSQILSAARVLDIELSCLYLPDVLLVSFDDSSTSTSSVKLIRQGSSLDIGKLYDAYSLYWKVIHDKLSVADASADLDALMRRPQMYSWWKAIFFGGMCSASICSVSFSGSFIDSLISFPLGALLVSIQLLSVRNELYSNVFEVTMATLFSFLSAALAQSHRFCYTAVASSSVVLILPGFIVLCGALELMSRNIVAGSVRLCYAVVYAIFLGFGLAIGNRAFEKIYGTAVFAPEDYTCDLTHISNGPWYQRTPSKFWAFLTVPMYSLFLSLRLQAPYNRRELLLLVAVSCIGWVVNYFTGTKFPGQSDIIAAVGAFAVSLVANLYARFLSGNAFTIMITGILFQVPSGLGSGGLLNYASQQSNGSTTSYISGFQTALNLVSVAIGLTVGLGISLVVTHPIQSRRLAGGVFSL